MSILNRMLGQSNWLLFSKSKLTGLCWLFEQVQYYNEEFCSLWSKQNDVQFARFKLENSLHSRLSAEKWIKPAAFESLSNFLISQIRYGTFANDTRLQTCNERISELVKPRELA